MAITQITSLSLANADLTLTSGDFIFGTAGKGICLGVTSNTDVNTLDDYEEGLWDVTFKGSSGSAGSQAYNGDASSYIKIGRMVYARFYRSMSNKGSWSGHVQLWGLPFTVALRAPVFFAQYPSTVMDAAYRSGFAVAGAAYMNVWAGSRMDAFAQYSEIDSGYYFQGEVIYETDS